MILIQNKTKGNPLLKFLFGYIWQLNVYMSIKRLYNLDESILQGIRSSDDAALRHLYKVCYPFIRNLVLKNSGTIDDIDDILQEGIIVFYEKVKSDNFTITCSITTFIYSICRNIWLKNLKKKSLNIPFTKTHESIDFTDDTIDEENILNEKQRTLVVALRDLGDPCKSILTCFYYEQFSMEKIAEKFGYTNADNAKTQKYKCLQRLKSMMFSKIKKNI